MILPECRTEPKLLNMVSKGTVDVAALTSASVETADYVAPADRYAVRSSFLSLTPRP